MLSLTIQKRDVKVAPQTLRSTGIIPAVYYGPKEESTPVQLSMVEFKKVLKKAGESSVIILKDDAGVEHEALHVTRILPGKACLCEDGGVSSFT